MKKILVIGSGGAGKSTFAKRLGEILKINVIHMDQQYWLPGWVEPPKPAWAARVDALCNRAAWIMDGNYSGTLERRLVACDAVVFLDLPPLICLWRVFKRLVKYHNTTRPDMGEGCRERFSFQFLLWVWSYRRRTRPKIVQLLKQHEGKIQIIWLRSSEEVEKYLRTPETMAQTE